MVERYGGIDTFKPTLSLLLSYKIEGNKALLREDLSEADRRCLAVSQVVFNISSALIVRRFLDHG
jgi:hypothetical protein